MPDIFIDKYEKWKLVSVAKFLLLAITLLTSFTVSGQQLRKLEVKLIDKDTSFLKKYALNPLPAKVKNEVAAKAVLRQHLLQLQSQSFLAASIDSLVLQDSSILAYLYIGDQFEWAHLENGNISTEVLEEVGYREQLFFKKPFSYSQLAEFQEKLLTFAENNGYPFATTQLTNIKINDKAISATINLYRGELYVMEKVDLVEIPNKSRISRAYLSNYLSIKQGDVYDERKIQRIRNRLKELPFLKQKKDPVITFVNGKATVNLFLENKKASRFDFLVGFLPNDDPVSGRTKLNLSGNANIDLFSPFGTGKRLQLEWQQLKPLTQKLKAKFIYPYVLNLPFGLDLDFDLYKQDTSFIDVKSIIGVQYLLRGGNYVKGFWENTSTTLLSIDTARIKQNRRLPGNLDISNSTFGLEYRYQRLNYRFNPRKGWDFMARAGAGLKRIKTNNDILKLEDPVDPEFKYSSLYDSLNLNSFQYKIDVDLAYFIPVFKRMAIMIRDRNGIIISQNPLYTNELYRLGGNKLLRGFDEELLRSSWYNVATIEWRYLLSTNSYFYLFGDFGYVEEISVEKRSIDRPIGFGAGLALETPIGVFGLSYALGKRQGNPFLIRNAKIHFGYVNYF